MLEDDKGGVSATNSFYKISLDIRDYDSRLMLKAKKGDTELRRIYHD